MLHYAGSCGSLSGRRVRRLCRNSAATFCAAVLVLLASTAFAQSPSSTPGRPVLALQTGHWGSVLFVAISPDGRWVATSPELGPVKLWSISSSLEVRSFSLEKAYSIVEVEFTSDSARLFVRSLHGDNYDVSLWELRTGRELRRFSLGDDVQRTSLSADGSQLAVAKVGDVELWNVANGRRVRRLGRGPADAVAFTPDGRALAAAGPAGDLTLWDAASGTQLSKLPVPLMVKGRLSFSPDGRWLAFQDDTHLVWLWDTVARSQPRLLTQLTSVAVVQFTADGGELVVHEPRSRRSTAFETATGRQTRAVATPSHVYAGAIGSNGRLLAGGGGNENIVVLEVNHRPSTRKSRQLPRVGV